MSSYHSAAYAVLNVTKAEATEKVVSILQRHNIMFLHEVRQFFWDADFDEFSPDIENELGEVESYGEALQLSEAWPCICLDVQYEQWASEFFIYVVDQNVAGIGIDFPGSLFDMVKERPDIATRWLQFVLDLSDVFDSPMLCGSEVLIQPKTETELNGKVMVLLKKLQKGVLGMHTAILNQSTVTPEILELGKSLSFSVTYIEDKWVLLTLLPFKQGSLL